MERDEYLKEMKVSPMPLRHLPTRSRYTIPQLAKLLGVTSVQLREWKYNYGYPNTRIVSGNFHEISDMEIRRGQLVVELYSQGFMLSELFSYELKYLFELRRLFNKVNKSVELEETKSELIQDQANLTTVCKVLLANRDSLPAEVWKEVKPIVDRLYLRGRLI